MTEDDMCMGRTRNRTHTLAQHGDSHSQGGHWAGVEEAGRGAAAGGAERPREACTARQEAWHHFAWGSALSQTFQLRNANILEAKAPLFLVFK